MERKVASLTLLRSALVVLFLLLPCPAQPQEGGQRLLPPTLGEDVVQTYEGSHALLIGVRQYRNGWTNLPGVQRDIERIRETLHLHGFESETLMDPTRTQFDQAVRRFIGQWGQTGDNRLLIYFAGHGHTLKTIDGRELGYLVPSDAPLPRRDIGAFREQAVGLSKIEVLTLDQEIGAFKEKAISMSEIEGYALQIEAKHVLFVFDSCFSGSLFDTLRGLPESVRAKASLPVRQFITAGTADQQVPDESIFSVEFVEGLKGEADLIRDGVVTGSELGMFLEKMVTQYSQGTQTPMYGKIRHPKLDKGDFLFTLPEKLRKQLSRSWTKIPARPVHAKFDEVPTQEDSPGDATLPSDAPLERMLRPQERHGYRISLTAGQYLHVRVEQEGVDTVVIVTDPLGEKIAEVDTNGDRGAEEVQWIATFTGTYHLEVRPKGGAPGRYRIWERELRAAIPRDFALEKAKKLGNEAATLFSEGKYSEALQRAEEALTIREMELGLNHISVAESLGVLGAIYLESGDYDRAEACLKRALAIRNEAPDPGPPLTIATLLDRLASLQATSGRYAEAEQSYRRALVIRESFLGRDHPEVAASLNNLGRIFESLGKLLEAEALYRRALAIRENTLGASNPEVAASLNNLASVLYMEGKYVSAEELYLRALAVNEKALGPDHPYVAQSLHNLAALYNEMAQYEKAISLLERALMINERTYGRSHPAVAQSLDNLGAIHLAREDLDRAEPLLRRALAIREEFTPDSPNLAITLGNLGALYRRKKDLARAEESYRRALTLYEKAYGPHHSYVAFTLNNLGILALEQGNPSKALEHLNRALEAFRVLADRMGEAQTLSGIGRALAQSQDEGAMSQALEHFRSALALYRIVGYRQGEAQVLGSLGEVLAGMKDPQQQREAMEYFLQALRLAQEVGDRQGEANVLDQLGRTYEALGDWKKALLCHAQAREIRREIQPHRQTGSDFQGPYSLAKCEVQITEPHSGQEVGGSIEVKGSVELPPSYYLWVFARPHNFHDLGVWWPQYNVTVDPDTRKWEAVAVVGGPQNIGDDFDLAAAVFAEDQHVQLVRYLSNAATRNNYLPIEMPPVACISATLKVKKVRQ